MPIAGFTFNCLTREQISALHQVGTKAIGTANHPLELEAWAAIGEDAIVNCLKNTYNVNSISTLKTAQKCGMHFFWESCYICVQGKEAGGHCGSWLTVSDKLLPLLPLILQSKSITNIPLIAAGGLMNTNDIKTETFAKFRFTRIFATSRKINTMILIYF
ncbi:Nitronate monooxygenase [Suttonella ornithocola]|uniref:Nitronate monooxygenase n=1 Tax=Suttonella ornithocola TaxID=279832 RepID=A0A380MMV1_9GAMM|nr:nitronate monooxygenase [Suttonella ornithocola]SUO93959.1 Nitronate monooxygenase [Suttonella ornithocola]